MTSKEAATLVNGQKVQFSDGRIAQVMQQNLTLSFIGGSDMFPIKQTQMIKLQFEDQSIGYLNWMDMGTVSPI